MELPYLSPYLYLPMNLPVQAWGRRASTLTLARCQGVGVPAPSAQPTEGSEFRVQGSGFRV